MEVDTPVESMPEVIVKTVVRREMKARFESLALEPERGFEGVVEVRNGQETMNGGHFIHYHHLYNKGGSLYTYSAWAWQEVPDSYIITKHGVFRHGHALGKRFFDC